MHFGVRYSSVIDLFNVDQFLSAINWFLRKFENGAFCTLPHAIEPMQVDFEKLFYSPKHRKRNTGPYKPFYQCDSH